MRVALNTQTPLVRFRDDVAAAAGDRPLDLSGLVPLDDYKFTTGGVVRMVFPLLKRWLGNGSLSDAEWVAMSAGEHAPHLTHDGVSLSFVPLPAAEREGYAQVKERLWALLNSNPTTPVPFGSDGLPESAWRAFGAYQERSARTLERAARRMSGVDLLYVHDFQQLGVAGAWRGPDAPKVFHLHTPFPTGMPGEWVDYMLDQLHDFDAVVVSTQRYADNLRKAGLRTPLHVVHPFIDPSDYREAAAEDGAAFRARFGIATTDRVVLNVARMDPMKGQDRMIRALPRLLEEVPEARLLFVGNGSFSSSRKGGLGLSKGQQWRARLEALAAELGVTDRVTFTGHLDDEYLPAAYRASDAFCLPSTREGFGLAVVEAWRQALPVIVSDRAGVSELVTDGEDGRVVDCGDAETLARALVETLVRPEHARAMGEAGVGISELATLTTGQRALEGVFASVLAQKGVTPHASV